MIATFISLAAAANAALLAAALIHRSWGRRAPAGLYAGAFLLTAAAAVALIAIDHANAPLDPTISAFAEGALTLLVGPLLVLFVSRLLGLRQAHVVLFAPLALFLAAALAWPAWTAQAFVVERLVLVQMGYTAYAAFRVFSFEAVGQRAARTRRIAIAALGAFVALHIAQIVRMLWPRVDAVSDIVPLVGAAAFVALTAAVYFGGRMTALEPLTEAAPAPTEEARALLAALDRILETGLLRDANLTLAQTAARLGVTPDAVLRGLVAVRGLSFIEYLQRRRVEEAQRLLNDPAEARTSMEAIGLLAGFGSRSAFYKAFTEIVGISPAAYRAQHEAKGVQKPEIGQ